LASYANLHQVILNAKKKLEYNHLSFESIHEVLFGIESFFTKDKIEYNFKIFHQALIDSLANVQYEFFESHYPHYFVESKKFTANNIDILWANEIVDALYKNHYFPFLKKMASVDELIQQNVRSLFLVSSPFKKPIMAVNKQRKKMNSTCIVGQPFLAESGMRPFNYFGLKSNTVDKSKDECLHLLVEYLDVVDEFHENVLSHSQTIFDTVVKVSKKFLSKEEAFYSHMAQTDKSAKKAFQEYFDSEKEEMNRTYSYAMNGSFGPVAISAIVESVMGIVGNLEEQSLELSSKLTQARKIA
jgi:hypothetical protein